MLVLNLLNALGSTANSVRLTGFHWILIGFVIWLIFSKKRDCAYRYRTANNPYWPATPVAPPNRPAAASPPPAAAPVYADVAANAPPVARRESPTRKRWKFTSIQPIYQPPAPRERLTQLVGSFMLAAVISAVIGLVAMIFRGDFEPSQYAWLTTTSIIGSWCVLAAAKLWEGRHGDPALRRFTMLAVGLALGAASFGLYTWLLTDFQFETHRFEGPAREFEHHFYTSAGDPQIIAFLAYFGFLFLTVRWWRSADPVRKNRFSIWHSAVIMAWSWFLGSFFLPFPQPWGVMLAATMAITIQLASPWLTFAERAQLPCAPEGD